VSSGRTGGELDAHPPSARTSTGAASQRQRRTPWWYHARVRAAHPLSLLLVLACSSAQRAEPAPKVVDAPPKTSSPTGSTDAASPVPAWLTSALTWPALTREPLHSAHLARPQLAELRVNPEAKAAYLGLVADGELPSGTCIVEVHRDAATGRSGPIFALVRAVTAWEFFVFDGAGHPLATPAYCSGCHAGAPAAPVFGLPLATKTSELNATAPRCLE
jgi:hypothetical protein